MLVVKYGVEWLYSTEHSLMCVALRRALFIDGEMAINVNSDEIFLFVTYLWLLDALYY